MPFKGICDHDINYVRKPAYDVDSSNLGQRFSSLDEWTSNSLVFRQHLVL